MSAAAWKRRRAKNPHHNLANRWKRIGASPARPCRLCGAPFRWWQWGIGRGDKAGLSRANCGCWFDVRKRSAIERRGTP